MTTSSGVRPRWFAAGRLVWGIALLVAPRRIYRVASGSAGTSGTTTVVRVLGVREAAQASFGVAAPTPFVLAAGATVDGVHALTMLAVALSRRYRRPAVAAAGVAFGFTLIGLVMVRRPSDRKSPAHTKGAVPAGWELAADAGRDGSSVRNEPAGAAGESVAPSLPGHPRLIFAVGDEARELPEDDRLISHGFELCRDVTTIGSAPSADLRLPAMAPVQARIVREANELIFLNVATASPSRINGADASCVLLRTGHGIEMGRYVLTYSREEVADHA